MKTFHKLLESERLFRDAQRATTLNGKAVVSAINQFWNHSNKKVQAIGDSMSGIAKHSMELSSDDDLRDVAEYSELEEEFHPAITKAVRSTREYIRTGHPKHLKAAVKPLADYWQVIAKEHQNHADVIRKMGEE